MTYSTFGDVVSCSLQNNDKSDTVEQGCTARQVVLMRPAATFVSYACAIKIVHCFGRLVVPFIAVFRARPSNRLTLSVMTSDEGWMPLLWREVKQIIIFCDGSCDWPLESVRCMEASVLSSPLWLCFFAAVRK